MVKIGAVIQARTGSERLPNKALLPLPFSGGPAMLAHVVERARHAFNVNEIIVATSRDEADYPIVTLCKDLNVACFRGDLNDVLGRFYQAAKSYKLDIIVRLTGDNPFVMPETIQSTIQSHIFNKSDYTISEGLPLGANVEVFSFKALEEAALKATQSHEREHVTPYIRQNKNLVQSSVKFNSPIASARLTVDYPSDFALANLLYESLYQKHVVFNFQQVEELISKNPWMLEVNADKKQKQVFATQEEELSAALNILKLGGFERVYKRLKAIKDD